MQCEKHLVSQGRCQRAATVCRYTSAGKAIRLCQKCDDSFGKIIGQRRENCDAINAENRMGN